MSLRGVWGLFVRGRALVGAFLIGTLTVLGWRRVKCLLRGQHTAERVAVLGGFRCTGCGFVGRDLGEMGVLDDGYVREHGWEG